MGTEWWFVPRLGKIIELTKHASERKAENAVRRSEIDDALMYGWQRPGTKCFYYRDLVVVAEKAGNTLVLITVYRQDLPRSA